jgi:hypothetical protein
LAFDDVFVGPSAADLSDGHKDPDREAGEDDDGHAGEDPSGLADDAPGVSFGLKPHGHHRVLLPPSARTVLPTVDNLYGFHTISPPSPARVQASGG